MLPSVVSVTLFSSGFLRSGMFTPCRARTPSTMRESVRFLLPRQTSCRVTYRK